MVAKAWRAHRESPVGQGSQLGQCLVLRPCENHLLSHHLSAHDDPNNQLDLQKPHSTEDPSLNEIVCAWGSLIKTISHLDCSRGLLWRQETGPLQTIYSLPNCWKQPTVRAPPSPLTDICILSDQREETGRGVSSLGLGTVAWVSMQEGGPTFFSGQEGIFCRLHLPCPCSPPGGASPGK